MGTLRRFLARVFGRLGQSDEERLRDEISEWAGSVPGIRRIADCPGRERVRICGVVRRLTLRPQESGQSLEAVVTDGTGEIVAVWTGRSHIPGLSLGTRVILEGMVSRDRDALRTVNPSFEFAAE